MSCNLAGSLKLNDSLNYMQMEVAPPWWRNEVWQEDTQFDEWMGQELWFQIPTQDRMMIEARMKIGWILQGGHYYRTWENYDLNIRNGQDCYEMLSSNVEETIYERNLGFRNPNIKNKVRDFGLDTNSNKTLLLAIGLGLAIS